MIGNNENIHGWNPDYRADSSNTWPPRYRSFDFKLRNPQKFHSEEVRGHYHGRRAFDHQSHIVPRHVLDRILGPIAQSAYASAPKDLMDLDNFLSERFPDLNFALATNYITSMLIANGAPSNLFVNKRGRDAESYLGGYFSVIMWNPINICRAPSNERRGGYPHDRIDDQVIDQILVHPDKTGIKLLPGMRAAFQAVRGRPLRIDLETFVEDCNNSFLNQSLAPAGYYRFPWKDQHHGEHILIPADES